MNQLMIVNITAVVGLIILLFLALLPMLFKDGKTRKVFEFIALNYGRVYALIILGAGIWLLLNKPSI